MNLNRNLKNSLTDKNKGRRYKIAAAILAIFVLHFAWQFSFVQKENLRAVEDSLKISQLEVLPANSRPDENTVEVKTDLAVKKIEVEKSAKKSAPVKFSPVDNESSQTELKKQTARESRSERLRRAEKLLTGF